MAKLNLQEIKKYPGNFFSYVRKTRWLFISVIALVVFALLYLGRSLFIAAMVNGRPITRFAFESELEKQGGKSVLDNLITKSLIFQEADRQKVTITQDEINTELTNIENMLKAQNMTLDDALKAQGETKEGLIEQIKLQKTVEAILGKNITISDQEIKDYFDKNKSSFATGAKLEDVKSSIQNTLYQQKLSDAYGTWINGLKSKAKIIYFLNF